MKVYKTKEFIKVKNPTPGERYRSEILSIEHGAHELAGIFVVLVPGDQIPYHYHKKRESLLIILDGEATEIVEGEEFSIKAGDVIYIPAGEKHMTVNKSQEDVRYLEFYTPIEPDSVDVE